MRRPTLSGNSSAKGPVGATVAIRITQAQAIRSAEGGGRLGVGPWPRAGIEQGISTT